MRSLYKKLNGTLPNNSTQTRKLLQGIIACVEDEEKAKKIIGPLYSRERHIQKDMDFFAA